MLLRTGDQLPRIMYIRVFGEMPRYEMEMDFLESQNNLTVKNSEIVRKNGTRVLRLMSTESFSYLFGSSSN